MTKTQIKRLRLALRLTQAQLALKVGVNHSTISLWESGARKPGGPAVILLRNMWHEMANQPAKGS